MRFWITKNKELPVREQLVRQITLAILSDDLQAGERLPSVRALARRHKIHANTVSAAYHDLLEQGWLELRRGSGLYVRRPDPSTSPQDLDRLLAVFLQSAQAQGHGPEDVLQRLQQLVRPRRRRNIIVVEPEPAMREILKAELAEHLGIAIEAVEEPGSWHEEQTMVVALPTRVQKLRSCLPARAVCIALRLRSAGKSLEGQVRPGPHTVITIVSSSPEIRYWSRAMLIAAGVDPEALCEIDATSDNWQDRIGRAMLVVTDVVTAQLLPEPCEVKVFRVIADASLAELKKLCAI